MVPFEKSTPRKPVVPNWLVFGTLGLAATAAGIFLPRGLRSHTEPQPVAIAPPAHEAPAIPAHEAPATPVKGSLDYTPPPMPDLPSPGAMFLRLACGTTFVLLLCVITLWVGKRWIRPPTVPSRENRQLRIVESLALGGRCSVYLLQAGDAKVLAGVDGAGIKALLPLPAEFAGTLADMTAETVGEAS